MTPPSIGIEIRLSGSCVEPALSGTSMIDTHFIPSHYLAITWPHPGLMKYHYLAEADRSINPQMGTVHDGVIIITMLCHAISCHAMPCYAMPCHAM